MKKTVIFIDGNNLYHNLKEMKIKPGHIDFYKLVSFICKHFNCELQEARYYNSIPTLREGKELYFAHLKFIDTLKNIPGFTIITRKLQLHSTKELLLEKEKLIESMDLCCSCKPIVKENILDSIGNLKKKEKGIDVKLAIDLVDYAINKKGDILILFSGDADFIPALELVKEKGTEVVSSSLAKGYSSQLRKNFTFFPLGRNMILENCLK